MDTRQFLSTVLAAQGYYCVTGIHPKRKVIQKFYNTLDSVVSAADNLDAEGKNAYFALGTFVEAGSREAQNVQLMKSFYLDLDCGEGKPFTEKTHALTALRAFCKIFKLPRPTFLVDSGRGIHVYWCLPAGIPRSEWLPVALLLDAACSQSQFDADTVVTKDAARILRIPGTHNYKDLPPTPVTIISEGPLLAGLEVFKDAFKNITPPMVFDTPVGQTVDDTMANLMGISSQVKKFSRLARRSLQGAGCEHVSHALLHPEDIDYGQWTDVLSIAVHCEDATAAIHKVSAGYPSYTVGGTDTIAASLTAPHLCATFDRNAPGKCGNCPHFGKIKSPITMCIEVKEATPADNVIKVVDPVTAAVTQVNVPIYPKPYFRGANGGVFLRKIGKDGAPEEVPVYRDDLYIIKRLYDPQVGPTYVFRLHTPREGIKEFTIAGVKLSSREDFRKEMGMHDVFLLKSDMLMDYVGRWISELQVKSDQIPAKIQFGWTSDKFESFVVGDKEYYGNRIEDNPASSATAAHFPGFTPRGSLAGWQRTLSFYNRDGFEVHQYMMGLAFGAPLMALTPIPGAVFHAHSPGSGYGKTTGMYAGASVWGSHRHMVLSAKDTMNSQWLRAELYKNLPLYIDELTNVEPKELSTFVYTVTDGKQKNRMSNAGLNQERVRGEPWNLIVGTTANVSLLERMNLYKYMPEGESQRILESRVEKMFFESKDKLETDKLSNELIDNYGHAGPVFIQYVINNLDAVKTLLRNTQLEVDALAGLSSSNRIWSAQVACVITGIKVAKLIGLVDFDVPKLTAYAIDLLDKSKRAVKELNVGATELISQYYAENFHGILRIKSTDDSRRQNGQDTLITPDAAPRTNWVMRHEYDINTLYMMIKPLKQWCTKQGINFVWLIDACRKGELQGRKGKIRMGRGTRINLPAMDALIINWEQALDMDATGLAEEGIIDGATAAQTTH